MSDATRQPTAAVLAVRQNAPRYAGQYVSRLDFHRTRVTGLSTAVADAIRFYRPADLFAVLEAEPNAHLLTILDAETLQPVVDFTADDRKE